MLKSSFATTFSRGDAASSAAPDEKPPQQPMKVISAGQGRTGTASLKSALARLGLKAYHMKDGAMETPGHMDLWLDYSEAELQSPGSGGATLAKIVKKMAEDGFNATTDMPACYIFEELLRQYPDARVVLSVRHTADAWASSVLGTIGRNLDIFGRVPFKWIPMMTRVVSMNMWMWKTFGLSDDGFDARTRMPTHTALVAGHDEWVERVKRSVPARKLLVLRPEDGYEPLCTFVSPVDAVIAAACQEVLSNNEPYPRKSLSRYMYMYAHTKPKKPTNLATNPIQSVEA